MKMDEMNAYFESEGFTVKRYYEPDESYSFIISRNNNHVCGKYKWPANQTVFMNDLILKFEKEFGPPRLDKVDEATRIIKSGINSIYGKMAPYNQHGFFDAMTAYATYQDTDRISIKEMWSKMYPYSSTGLPKIKNVIFNDPATIVFWSDNTKTVVKAQNDDIFDPEKGLVMAISKKALGNKGNYCNVLKKWLPEEETKETLTFDIKLPSMGSLEAGAKAMEDLANRIKFINKQSDIRSAYEILDKVNKTNGLVTEQYYKDAVKDALAYLKMALED